jgi:hypothetical protein
VKVPQWAKFVLPVLVTVAIGGIYLAIVFYHRSLPGIVRTTPEQQLTADDVAAVRMEFPMHFEDVKELEGKSVWMKNGNTMPFYPYVGGSVEWTHPAGLIPPAQRLVIEKAIKAQVPAAVHDNVGHGDRQVLLVFTLPDGKDEFATPVGAIEGAQSEEYYCDLLFYYDDPHTIYSNWPKDVWAAIDAHQVKLGFSELETRMAIGQRIQPSTQSEGDRTVDYNVNGKHYQITYEHNHATSIVAK